MEIIKTNTAKRYNSANFISIFQISKNQYVELTVTYGTKAYVVMRDNEHVFQEISGTAKFNSKLSKKENFTIAIIDFREKTAKRDLSLTQYDKVILCNPTQIQKIESISFTFTYKMTKTAEFKHFVEDLLRESQYKEVPSDWFINDTIETECIAKVTRDLLFIPENSDDYPILPSTNVILKGGIEGMNIPQRISMIGINIKFNLTEKGLDDTEKKVRQINLTTELKEKIAEFERKQEIKKNKIRAASPEFQLKVIAELKQLKLDSATSKKVLNIFFEEKLASDLSNEMEEM